MICMFWLIWFIPEFALNMFLKRSHRHISVIPFTQPMTQESIWPNCGFIVRVIRNTTPNKCVPCFCNMNIHSTHTLTNMDWFPAGVLLFAENNCMQQVRYVAFCPWTLWNVFYHCDFLNVQSQNVAICLMIGDKGSIFHQSIHRNFLTVWLTYKYNAVPL